MGHSIGMRKVTTVIVTRNDRAALLNTLTHHHPPVIVVDNGSSDGSAQAAAEMFPHVRVLKLANDWGMQAFNIGARAAQTRYLAFSDDRSWWEKNALEHAAKMFQDHPSVGLLAVASIGLGDRLPDSLTRELGQQAPGSVDTSMPGVPALGFVDCFCVVRRQPFLDVGGFDNIAGLGGHEQRLALDMADAGWAVRFLADLVVWRPRHTSIRLQVRQVRDDVSTALMRRPAHIALYRSVGYLRGGIAGWSGVFRALGRSPRALRRRRRISARVETRARVLETSRLGTSRQ